MRTRAYDGCRRRLLRLYRHIVQCPARSARELLQLRNILIPDVIAEREQKPEIHDSCSSFNLVLLPAEIITP